MSFSKYEIEAAIVRLKNMIHYRRVTLLTDPRDEINKKHLLQDEEQLEALTVMLFDPEVIRA